MNLASIINEIRQHPEFERVGMILSHQGVVRGVSRGGRPVSGITLKVDRDRLRDIVNAEKKSPGIIELVVKITDQTQLAVGDDIMLIVVAGDIRENVIPVLERTLNSVKQTVTHKIEHAVSEMV